MPQVEQVDLLGVLGEDPPIQNPYVEISNILLLNQVQNFTLKNTSLDLDVLIVPCYGVKGDGILKYIGLLQLSAASVLRMEYLGLKVRYVESEGVSTDFSKEEHLIGISTNKELVRRCLS